ncbi:hypothetical protein ABZ923_11980 [Streptomyces sp. NPDC046881]|uniref:hypothetical protein n=1 Tax=Streptomyces sp. NPDC046881 TaxID=3155374 RepID=UPI0033ED83F7
MRCVVVQDGVFGSLKGVEALLAGGGLVAAASVAALSRSAVRLRSARRSATVGAPWRAWSSCWVRSVSWVEK